MWRRKISRSKLPAQRAALAFATALSSLCGFTQHPSLSAQAMEALARAEADVKQATVQKSLWTTADEALKKARQAAARGDSQEAVKQSAVASEQALLGIEQIRYPLAR